MKTPLQNHFGFSLIEVLLACAIVSVISMAIASVIQSQNKEFRSLYQKADALELRNSIFIALNNLDICRWQFKNHVINVIGASPTDTGIGTLPLPAIYAGLDINSLLLARQNTKLSTSLSGLEVTNISFADFYTTGMPNEYRGTLSVNFNAASLVRAMKPITVAVSVLTDPADPNGAKRITDCSAASYGKIYTVPFADLAIYHTGLESACANMNTAKMFWDAACSRYCGKGCAGTDPLTQCGGTAPGKSYTSGLANDCIGTTNSAQCFCFH